MRDREIALEMDMDSSSRITRSAGMRVIRYGVGSSLIATKHRQHVLETTQQSLEVPRS